jgi:quercetin dioxygenase-like cupin family protein
MRRLLLTILLGLPAATLSAQDPVAVSPKSYRIELENAWVRVLRVKLGSHEKTAMHAQPSDQVVVYLTDAHARVTRADGSRTEVAHGAHEVGYVNRATQAYAEENLSDRPLEAILVELKPGAPKSPPIALDVVKLDAEHHLVPLENERVRVLRTILEPHLKSPMHEHPHYVVVYLTELHTTMKMADGREVDNPRRPGEVAWRDALKHETENIGEKTAVEIQIELK